MAAEDAASVCTFEFTQSEVALQYSHKLQAATKVTKEYATPNSSHTLLCLACHVTRCPRSRWCKVHRRAYEGLLRLSDKFPSGSEERILFVEAQQDDTKLIELVVDFEIAAPGIAKTARKGKPRAAASFLTN